MESRQRPTHKRNPGLRDNNVASDSVHADLPHIAALIGDGEITLGTELGPGGFREWLDEAVLSQDEASPPQESVRHRHPRP